MQEVECQLLADDGFEEGGKRRRRRGDGGVGLEKEMEEEEEMAVAWAGLEKKK